ncbi:MAG: 4'-phosphopantetheinyl transferase [Alphaproteobacteria bacterium]
MNNNVVIWCISTPNDHLLETAASRLPEHERQRSARFKNTHHAQWWAYVHLAMRNILGAYTQHATSDLRFQYSAKGKPSLAIKHEPAIFFNLSHCSDIALLAVSDCPDLGVDVENVKAMSDMSSVAKHVFSDAEQHYFENLSDLYKVPGFYKFWTQKESIIKANGGGLSLPLDAFDVVGVTSKKWKNIIPKTTHFGLQTYLTRELCLSEFGLSETHMAAITFAKQSGEQIPKIKMLTYLPDSF